MTQKIHEIEHANGERKFKGRVSKITFSTILFAILNFELFILRTFVHRPLLIPMAEEKQKVHFRGEFWK